MVVMAGAEPIWIQQLGASLWSCTWVQGPEALELLSVAFPGRQLGAGSEVEQLRLKLVSRWDAGTADGGSVSLATKVTLDPVGFTGEFSQIF